MKSTQMNDEATKCSRGEGFILQQQLLPFRFVEACAFCGHLFEIARGRGRPQKFCSDPCRLSRVNEQKRDWAQRAADGGGQKV